MNLEQLSPGTLRRRTGSQPAPLSYAQERMWFLNQLEPGTTMYSGVRATRWTGALDQKALERTVGELVRRHEILRTCFPLRAAGPTQEIEPLSRQYQLPSVDLSTGGPAAALAAARSWLLAESRRPFELTREPPFRASLLRLSSTDHVLALTIHHIAFDRWSRSVLKRELMSLYSAFAGNRPSPLEEPPLQYQDYAEWQRDQTAGKEFEQSLTYWRDQLRGAPPALHLPRDNPQQTPPTYLGRQTAFHLSPELAEELARLSRRERASLFMTLLAAFNAFLWRVTGQTDLVVGVPIAGRTRLELSGLIGCFTNTLVLRTDLSGDPSFRELLGRVRRVALAGYAHQDLPFERLVRELQPERTLGKHPLFQVLFNYLDFPLEPLNPPGLEVEELEVRSKTALVDLSVDIRKSGQALACSFSCNAGLFETATVGRLARDYLAAMELFVSHPDSRISALPDSWSGSESTDADRLVQELEQMTDEEAERLLAAELRGEAQ